MSAAMRLLWPGGGLPDVIERPGLSLRPDRSGCGKADEKLTMLMKAM
jgi:hypothetical protein